MIFHFLHSFPTLKSSLQESPSLDLLKFNTTHLIPRKRRKLSYIPSYSKITASIYKMSQDKPTAVMQETLCVYKKIRACRSISAPHMGQGSQFRISHFRDTFCLCVKTSLRAKPYENEFHLDVHFHANRTHFHLNGFA